MLTQFVDDHKDLHIPITFDNWYTQPAFCRFLDRTLQIPYVGTVAGDDQVLLVDGAQAVDAFDLHLQHEQQEARKHAKTPVFQRITITYKGAQEVYYSYCKTHRIHHFGKQRLVLNHRSEDLSDTATFYISNKLNWQAPGITRIRRHRWPVEVYHEEGKADGLDQYQVRDFQAIYKHISLVAVPYSLLRAAQHDQVLLHKLQRQLKTALEGSAGFWRRHTQAQALWALATVIATGLSQGQTLSDLMEPLMAALCY